MLNFLKIFFGCLLAIIVFAILSVFFIVGVAGGAASKKTETVIKQNSVLLLDLSTKYNDKPSSDVFAEIRSGESETPNLYNLIRLIQTAKNDSKIKGILLKSDANANGFATSEEIRNALIDFKQSKKFVYAYSNLLAQKNYYVANTADKIYVNPAGAVEWAGYNITVAFFKKALDKLEIEPQIFYAGKFKSATEPFRADKMTDENRLQTTVWLNDIYNRFIANTAASRKIDTTLLIQMADNALIKTPQDALKYKLIDHVKYEDEMMADLKSISATAKDEDVSLVTAGQYFSSQGNMNLSGNKIALLYAEGDIIDGKSEEEGIIASETCVKMIRKAKDDKSVKAILFRVNSGGGSAMASENIWRELSLAKKKKPVVVSFGNVAASGGYYIACAADSVYASPVTITGSIGVFGIIPNMEKFFQNKLGVTFDGVKTSNIADAGTFTHPIDAQSKTIIQQSINDIYRTFKTRVADARKMDTAQVETIAQGRVWAGNRAKTIGLVNTLGGMNDALKCVAKLAKLDDYYVQEYPKPKNIFEKLFGLNDETAIRAKLKEGLGEENFLLFNEFKNLKQMLNKAQTRIPFQFTIQ